MKKTLSIVLALALALSMLASFALVPTAASKPDPLQLKGIMVTNAAGYAAPYSAVDEANPFVENQTAYVIVSFEVAKANDSDYATWSDGKFQLTITSSTLDLTYADDTAKFVTNYNNAITTHAVSSNSFFGNGIYDSIATDKVVIKTNNRSSAFGWNVGFHPVYNSVSKYSFAFIAVTKPATAGEVKAAMKVAETSFDSNGQLVIYDAGVVKYTIVKHSYGFAATPSSYYPDSYDVYRGDKVTSANYLFTYLQSGDRFMGIGNPKLLTWSYDGKLIDTVDGTLGNLDDKDYTAVVAEVNTFFGFSFAYNNAAVDKNFSDKTGGNPVTVSDTYNYVSATVTTTDEDVDIVATGDFSANIVIVMAASAILAAAALAFVAKKARD